MNPIDHLVCLSRPRRLTMSSTWVGHVPFAMCLVDMHRPETLVELGAHTGVSYCAFCQAVSELGLGTRCFAVDTWEGDHQAGYYDLSFYHNLKDHNDLYYRDFSTLLKMTFDEALREFPDHSVDLLHIDGLHTYEAVSHDFATWLPKMSDKGVVLFHDIRVQGKDFGVWRFWDEVKRRYPHFEFDHSCGLGVLVVGATAPEAVQDLTGSIDEEAVKIRQFFARLGEKTGLRMIQVVNYVRSVLGRLTPQDGKRQTDVAIGELLLNLGENEAARQEFYRLLDEDGRDARACAGMAECLVRLGFLDRAGPFIKKAQEGGSIDFKILRKMAAWCFEHAQPEDGFLYGEAVLASQPDDIETLGLLLNERCKQGERGKALPLCEKLLGLCQNDPKLRQLWNMLSAPDTP